MNNGSFTSVQTVHAHTSFYTEELLHTEAFTQRTLAKEDHEHLSDVSKSQFLLGFGPLTFIPCKRVASEVSKPAILPAVFDAWHSFRATGRHRRPENAHFNTRSCVQHARSPQGGAPETENRISPHGCASDTRDLCRGCAGRLQSISPHVCGPDARDLGRRLLVPKTNSHFTTPLRARHARSTEKVRFRNRPPDCPCRLKREFGRTWEVGVV